LFPSQFSQFQISLPLVIDKKSDIFDARSKVIASMKIAPIKFHSKD